MPAITAFQDRADDAVEQAVGQRPPSDIRAMIGGDGEIGAALALAKAATGRAWIAPGTYTLNGAFDMGDMTIEAAPGAMITGTGAGAAMLTSSGTFTRIADLATSPAAGAGALTFAAAHGLSVGDWIVLYNPADASWHTARAYYREGEWAQVASIVSAATVQLSRPLYSGYAAAAVQVHRAALRTPRVTGGTWLHGAKSLAVFTACTGTLMTDFRSIGACAQAIYPDRCVKARIVNPDVRNAGAGGASDYGIVWGNSQHCQTIGGSVHARRHPIPHGGGDVVCAVPCRDVVNSRVTLTNDPAAMADIGDFHGNAEFCTYEDCDLTGTLGFGGANNGYRRCTVRSGGMGHIAGFTEVLGGRFELIDCDVTVTSAATSGGRGIVDVGYGNNALDAGVMRDVTLVWTGGRIALPNMAADNSLIRLHKAGQSAGVPYKTNIRFENVECDFANPQELLRTSDASGAPTSDFIILSPRGKLPAGSKYVVQIGRQFISIVHRAMP